MATPPQFLATRWRGGAGFQQVLLYDNGADVSQLGSDLSSSATDPSTNANSAFRNFAIKYAGRVFTHGLDGIYEKDDPTTATGAYTRVFTFTNAVLSSTGALSRCGLFPMRIGNTPRLVTAYRDASGTSNWRAVIYNPSTNSWSEGAVATLTPITFLTDVITYNNTLHIIGNASNTERALIYDPGTDGWTALNGAPQEPFPGSDLNTGLFIHKNRLLAISNDNTNIRLAEFSAGAWDWIATLEAEPTGSGAMLGAKFCGWSDGTDIRVLYMTSYGGLSNGWRAARVNDTTYAETNISAILPASLRHSDDGGSFAGNKNLQRFWVLTDMQTDPTSPKVYLYHTTEANSEGDTYSVYEYIDDATEMTTPVDTGGDSYAHAIPSGGGQHIGGSRFWTNTTAGHLDSLITDASEGTDAITFTYRGYNDSGGSRTLTVYFSTDGGLTLTQASLSAATGGSSSLSGNTVINVDPDGTTDYTVTVDYGLSGISDGDRVQYYLQLA